MLNHFLSVPMVGKIIEKLPRSQRFAWIEASRTCALWTCGSGFASNEAYSTNVSWQSLWSHTQNHPNPKHSKAGVKRCQERQESVSWRFLSLSLGTANCQVDCMASTAEVFQSNEMCCDKTCGLVKCQTGFKNKGEKALALTHDECCDTWQTDADEMGMRTRIRQR